MCGIVGYLGDKDVDSVILVGLEKLEYRGYDSAGIAAIHNGSLLIKKRVGRIRDLYSVMDGQSINGHLGIGHTRWATHGRPTEENAHPHPDCKMEIAVVHNGIIENYEEIRENLKKEGHIFRSETDSEVVSHLIEKYYRGSLKEAVVKAVKELRGSFALAIISSKEPNTLIGVRKDSPLVVGIGENEMHLASDIVALLSHTKKIVVLEDNEIAVLRRDGWHIVDFNGQEKKKNIKIVEWDENMVKKEGYPTFMLKEIFEQPRVIEENLKRYLRGDEFLLLKDTNLRRILLNKDSILIQACGTSLHAGIVGKYLLEKLARIKTEVDFSSEFRYREPVISKNTLVMAISQSGETADTLAGVRMAKETGLEVLSIINVVDSSIARESDYVIYINAGPEIGVASTKAYTAQILILSLLALELACLKGFISDEESKEYASHLRLIPHKIRKALALAPQVQKLSYEFHKSNNFMFLGRGINYPTALEGSLKLKEISYIHAIGYAAGEMKHGPIALVDESLPVVMINPKTSVYEKAISNMMEIKSRGGRMIGILTEGDERGARIADYTLFVPETLEIFTPIISVIPLQLLAYHIAMLRGCDVDKPRNLAKSVTVE